MWCTLPHRNGRVSASTLWELAYGIDICSVEEIGSFAEPSQHETERVQPQITAKGIVMRDGFHQCAAMNLQYSQIKPNRSSDKHRKIYSRGSIGMNNVAPKFEIFGLVHHSHTAADPAEYAVMGNRLPHGLGRRGHGRMLRSAWRGVNKRLYPVPVHLSASLVHALPASLIPSQC
jgi:hypothetical protein